MKKSIIVVVLLLVIIAALPIIGNSFMKNEINHRVNELQSLNLIIQDETQTSSYLSTHKHIELLLDDSTALVEYLNQHLNQKISPSTKIFLDGILVGVDINYSNLPFAKALEIEIYPLALSSDIKEELQKSNPVFEKYLRDFFQSKSLLYHVEYNLLNSKFKSHIKDIESGYRFNGDSELLLKLDGAKFSGEGSIINPDEMSSKLKQFKLLLKEKHRTMSLDIHNLVSESESKLDKSFETDLRVKYLNISVAAAAVDTNITINGFQTSTHSDTKRNKRVVKSAFSFKELLISDKERSLVLKKLAFKLNIDNLDREIFDKIYRLILKNRVNKSAQYQAELQSSLINLFEKGLTLKIKKFSLKDIELHSYGHLKGFDIKAEITINPDPSLKTKMALSPILAIGDIELHSKMEISKKLYSYMMQNSVVLIPLNSYVKENGDSVVFEIDIVDTKMQINSKAVN